MTAVHQHDERGPTQERLARSQGAFVIGGDDRSTRVYCFRDAPLQRLYGTWLKADRSADAQEQLGRELIALCKYRDHWYYAGLQPHVGSIDLNRVSGSGDAHGMAKSETQAHHRIVYRRAVRLLGMTLSRIVEHIACEERAVSDCILVSAPTFRVKLREAAVILAGEWG
jgi:hypothetical protein